MDMAEWDQIAMAVLLTGIRRSARRAGPLLIALLLGAVLVGSSVLSYRDAQSAAALIAERQGIAFLLRLDGAVGPVPIHSLRLDALLDANRAYGLTYVAVYDAGELKGESGHPVLGGGPPVAVRPTFGHGRVRMASPPVLRPPPGFFNGERPPLPGGGFSEFIPPGLPPGGFVPPMGPHQMVIEFEPILSEQTIRRALSVLVLSSSAAGLLTIAALILWAAAIREEQAELRSASRRHLAQLGEMSAVLAHEIRNPLASLKGHAQLLAEKVSDRSLSARVDRVVQEAVRLESLTNDLLDFARPGGIRVVPASPAEVLASAVAATKPDRIEMSIAGAPTSWLIDPARIQQLLINLIDNALCVTPSPAKVQARVCREGDALLYAVRDHGPGVLDRERLRVFEPFHTTKLRGTGLGLAVAKRIADLHGGRIDIADPPGGGAEFQVHLPAAGAARP
jgi:two-component system, NtrC family, sensor histidine kinase HydH